jgi:hypothetical protein
MSELTDRMRTCAAHIQSRKEAGDPWAVEMIAIHAAELLIEASEIMEAAQLGTVIVDDQTAQALGLPMEILQPPEAPTKTRPAPPGVWIGDDLKPIPNVPPSRNACPACDSRASKTVRRAGNRLTLECPVCGHMWLR